MNIKVLSGYVLCASLAVGAAAALILPPLLKAGTDPHTLVVGELGMAPTRAAWLAAADDRDPAAWLSGRLADLGASAGDVSRDRTAALIAALAQVYEETPRMIANRAAQLAEETRGDPAPARLLADLAWNPDSTHSFGAVAQNYLVLRRGGLGHDAAVATLRDALGEAG